MSTKIFDAWRWDGDFFSLSQELVEVRKELQNCVFERIKKYLARTSWRVVDNIKLYKTEFNTLTTKFEEHIKNSYNIDINKPINEEEIFSEVLFTEVNELHRYEESNLRADGVDFRITATVFPYKPNIQLLMFFIQDSESREDVNRVLNKHGFKEYYYTNQVDAPEEISEEEWDKRGADWDNVFAENGIPKYTGYDYIFTDSFLFEVKSDYSVKSILAYSEDVETRSFRLAKEYLEQKAIETLSESDKRKYSKIMEKINSIDKKDIENIQSEIIKIINN